MLGRVGQLASLSRQSISAAWWADYNQSPSERIVGAGFLSAALPETVSLATGDYGTDFGHVMNLLENVGCAAVLLGALNFIFLYRALNKVFRLIEGLYPDDAAGLGVSSGGRSLMQRTKSAVFNLHERITVVVEGVKGSITNSRFT